ncbi:hypothetical protein [Stenotrophomonas sp.]|uniref:hypothetical protein n=1 Tax=Stenotrophomonas sp. TaxID=69392 RepID=UPI0028AB77B4|nr:hypothetical protein [Stenotrophomonas sp.]
MDTLRAHLSTLIPEDQAAYAARCGTTIGYLRKALSKGQRFDGGLVRQLHVESGGVVSLTELRPDIWPPLEQELSLAHAVDTRMSKRALRARLGLFSDKQLATVLQLPLQQVEGWEEERALPAVPEVLRLLGVQSAAAVDVPPADPDDDRIVSVEVA